MVKHFCEKEKYGINDLLDIMQILRSPGGCPWDMEQTHKSIRNNMLEEAYEAADAIDRSDAVDLCEELGDVLMQVVLHSQISKEEGGFDFDSVCDGVCKKLVLRHPHVFGEVKAENSEQVLNNWDKIKKQEKNQQSFTETLQAVPNAFPSLMRAQKVQKRAAKAGFDWQDVSGPLLKLGEETNELKAAIESADSSDIFEEYGDLLFAVVNIARHIGVDAEQALSCATDKFINRFEKVEELCKKDNVEMDKSSLETLDSYWDSAKKLL